MNFDDISYIERNGTKKSGPGLLLPGGYWVAKSTVVLAWVRVCEVLPRLPRDDKYCAETLCGVEFWKSHRCGKRIAFGRCIKYFVVHELLPLRVANPGKKGKRKYIRA